MLENKVENYIEQQSLFKLMKFDLEKYKKAFQISKEYETMFSPFTNANLYSKEVLMTLQKKNDIIDLSKVIDEKDANVE